MSNPGKSSFPRGPLLGGFALLAALAATEAAAPGRFEEAAEAELDGGTLGEPSTTDTHRANELAVKAGRAIPLKPEDWQKRPPCLPDTEEARSGACYIRAARKPPCPPALFEGDGACFVAVAKAKRPDTSIEE